MSDYIDIVFTGPPSPEPTAFIDVEDEQGRSIAYGEWMQRDDGYWVLRMPVSGSALSGSTG